MLCWSDTVTIVSEFLDYPGVIEMSLVCRQWKTGLQHIRNKAFRFRHVLNNPRMTEYMYHHLLEQLLHFQNYRLMRRIFDFFSVPREFGKEENYCNLRALVVRKKVLRFKHMPIFFTTTNVQKDLVGCFFGWGDPTLEALICTFGRNNRIFFTTLLFHLETEEIDFVKMATKGDCVAGFQKIALAQQRCLVCNRTFSNLVCQKNNPGLGPQCYNRYNKLKTKFFFGCAFSKRAFCKAEL